MKKILLLLVLICSAYSTAQVTLDVGAIEVDQPVTITVDINSTDSDCNGYSNPTKVYMHSGIGDNSDAFGFSVIGNWGQDDGVGEMSNNGDGTYSITITPQTYYGLDQTQADNATQIGMVFRNEDGSQELKDNGCNDFIFPVGNIIINITQPSEPIVVINSGDNLTVNGIIIYQGSTTVQGTFEVFYNDVSVGTGTCSFPNCNITITNITESGTVRFVGTPPGSTETGEASFEVIIAPTVVEEDLPAGLVDGTNYNLMDETKATLVLNAPLKDFIYIAGSFNSYNPDGSYLMKQDPNNGKFWLELTGLTSGQIETYQYWVYAVSPVTDSPALVKTADPFSTLVLSPFDDPWIPETTYPNLPTYPAGQEREVTVLQTGQTAYNWQVTNFAKPKKEDLIIYEVLIRDFDADRNFQDLIDKIDYFKNLKINAIELLPVMEYEGNESWGYNTAFHMALDKFYGTEDKLKEFVDTCHQNGIAVILDVALNHAFGRNPMNRMWMNDPDGDGWGEPSSENPYFNEVATHTYSVGSDFNHQSTLTQYYTERVIKHWIQEFKIDGFRWDLTKGFTQNCSESDSNCTEQYQADRVAILKQYVDYSWSLDSNHYAIFEHLGTFNGSYNEGVEWADYRVGEGKGIMMWNKRTSEYSQLAMGYNSDTDISFMGHIDRGYMDKRALGYFESHDEERIMYRNLQFGNSSNGSHDVKDLNTALSRMSAIGAVSLTVPGPKMIWHFSELGMDNSIWLCNDGITVDEGNDNCKLSTKPQPQWVNNWLGDANRNQIYNDWARMISLKINEPVFEGDYSITTNTLQPRIYVWDNALPSTQLKNVVVLANFDVTTQNVTPDFPYTGNWYDLMDNTGGTLINVTNTASPISIEAGQFKIYGNQASTLSVDDFETVSGIAIYPNPANDTFTINSNISSLNIYDITGKLISEYRGSLQKGELFDVSELKQGIYILKLENNLGQKSSTKLIKL